MSGIYVIIHDAVVIKLYDEALGISVVHYGVRVVRNARSLSV